MLRRIASLSFGIILILASNVNAPGNARTPAALQALLQFTSGGHALGFAAGGMYAATGSHALHVDFAEAHSVQPKADSPASPSTSLRTSSDGKAAPLNQVTYANLWDGISLACAALPGSIYTTTYTLAPGADSKSIRLRYNAPLTLNEDGTLGIAFETGRMTESTPIAWQEINNQRIPVEVSFQVRGQEVGFALGSYNPRYALTIDPSLVWNTFLGGNGNDFGDGIAVDGSGNVYVTGESSATWGRPVLAYNGNEDAYVAKLNSSGALIWNTFLGGNGNETGIGLAVSGSGNIYVSGFGDATWGHPVRAFIGGNHDAFVAKLTSSGRLVWNTFLGGSKYDYGWDIAVDGSGNAYVTGESAAAWGDPVRAYRGGDINAFVVKLGSSGGLIWNTFLGPSSEGYGIAVDGSGNVYVTGVSYATWGSPVRAYSGGYPFPCDAFAAKLSSSGALIWNTFLGGNGTDGRDDTGIAVDGSGNVYVMGDTTGDRTATWGSPLRAYTCSSSAWNGCSDTFAAELDSSGGLTWNTFLGGSGYDYGHDIAVDGSGNVYVTGVSDAMWGSPVSVYSGGGGVFAVRLSSSGRLTWNTFLGGTSDVGSGIAVDESGNVYVTGSSEDTWGSPVRPCTSYYDAFVAKVYIPTISGNAGDAGVKLSYIDGMAKSVTSASDGKYTISVPSGWSGTVTPSKTGLNFTPTSRTYNNVTVSKSGQNYSAIRTFTSIGLHDGWLLESTETSGVGGSMNSSATTFRLGDDNQNRQYKVILSFNTASLPDTATVRSAVLKIEQSGSPAGTDPFTVLGTLYADIAKGFFDTKPALQLTDFSAAATTTKVAAFGKTPTSGWYSAALNATGRSNVNKTGLTQFRLYFVLDDNNNHIADFMKFFSGDYSGSTSRPQLIITYILPFPVVLQQGR